jgi:hypothetical protein
LIRLRRFFGIPENTGVFLKTGFSVLPKYKYRKTEKNPEKDKELGKNKIKMLVFQLILAENL